MLAARRNELKFAMSSRALPRRPKRTGWEADAPAARADPRKSLSATTKPLLDLPRRNIRGTEGAAVRRAMMGNAATGSFASAKPAKVPDAATVESPVTLVRPSMREHAWSQALVPRYASSDQG